MRRINVAQAPGKVARAARSFDVWGKPLRYTGHSQEAARQDRYGDLAPYLPAALQLDDARVKPVEVEMDERGATTKLVVRLSTELRHGTDTVDAVLVLVRSPQPVVKTVWGNLASDNHATLKPHRLS